MLGLVSRLAGREINRLRVPQCRLANAVEPMERLAAGYRQLDTMRLNNQSTCLADLLIHAQTTWLQTRLTPVDTGRCGWSLDGYGLIGTVPAAEVAASVAAHDPSSAANTHPRGNLRR
jgi:hypothetical protein